MEKTPGIPQNFVAREANHSERTVLEMAHQKAETVFRHEINMESFATPQGNYDPEMVKKDMELVQELRQKYEAKLEENQALADVQRISTVFEAMMADQIKNSNWFGGNTELIATSVYDDYVNHLDGILHFKVPGSADYLAIGADITFSKVSLEEKIGHIKRRIGEGKMARAKYFELPDGSFKGEIKDIPHIILGADSRSVIQMAEQWVNDDGKKYLVKHWMQAQLLDMAIKQCEVFAQFAKDRNNKNAEEKYLYMGEKIKRIKTLREKIGGAMPLDRDSMYGTLMQVLGERD